MKKTMTESGLVNLDTDKAHILHRKGDRIYAEIHHATVTPDKDDDYEELTMEQWEAAREAAAREAEYTRLLREMIHERYSIDDEIALGANINSEEVLADEAKADAAAEEYAAYQQYRAECKRRAKEILSTENNENDNV